MDLDFVLHSDDILLCFFAYLRWVAIVVTTLLIRSLTIPLLVKQLKAIAKLTISFVVCGAFLLNVFSYAKHVGNLLLLYFFSIEGEILDEEIFSVLIIHIETSYYWYCFLQLMRPLLEELKHEMEDKVRYFILVLAIDY